ncbi:tetratricopeptide repeat protein [Campylobacter volucris]|uniref:Tetratricopeptide repeat protein n=2 Tax=Campylobacter volucris TaxID=1031542 RepID=A0AAE6CZX4_9BACT|nr:tetratricopeptide repeat protein [Campylobacter volucris]KAB0579772.1 tetratricopeptide repeat protein [Campylobacter volucris]QBL13870.1 tetratricopeptide repeat protein [Campylobacter volucris]TXK70696.1 tetratricopeptide repeat protein [Campylobacter volucris]
MDNLIAELSDLAKEYFENSEFEKCEEILNELIAFCNGKIMLVQDGQMIFIDDENKHHLLLEAYHNRALCRFNCLKFQEALKDAAIAVEFDPGNVFLFNLLGLCNFKLNLLQEALLAFNKTIVLDNAYHLAYFNRARVYVLLNDYKKALRDLQACIDLAPEYYGAYYIKAIALLSIDPKQALLDFKKTQELGFECAELFYYQGIAYENLNEHQEAINCFTKAIENDKNYADAYYKRANNKRKINDLKMALQDCLKSIELDNKNATAYLILGHIYKDLKKIELSIKALKKSIELDEKLEYPYYVLANILYDLKEYNQALKYYDKAIELYE